MLGYYRCFIQHYASIIASLASLLYKDNFHWCSTVEVAFNKLKEAPTTILVLRIPNFSLPFKVETYASSSTMGMILTQQDVPIAYFSKSIFPSLWLASTYMREMTTIVEAVKKWCHYLQGTHFTIVTYQESLMNLLTHKQSIPQVYTASFDSYWVTRILSFT